MSRLARFAHAVDRLNDAVGAAVSWATVLVIVPLFVAVPLRYWVSYASDYLDNYPQLCHAAVFMVGAAYALRSDDHVRVDVLSRRFGARARAVIELIGTAIFLIPWLAVVAVKSWPIVAQSWQELEGFGEEGTPGYFLLKTLLLVFVALVGLQGLANAARALLTLISPGGVAVRLRP